MVPLVEPFDIEPPVPDVLVFGPFEPLVAVFEDCAGDIVPEVVVLDVPLLLGEASLFGTPVVDVLSDVDDEVWAKAAAGRRRENVKTAAINLCDT